MESILSIVGRNISRCRRECGYTQEKLAVLSGVGESYLGRLELGKENVSVKTLERLAEVLGVEINELLMRKTVPSKK